MKLMKLSAAFAAAALLLASCSTPTNSTLSSTDLANKSTVATTLATGNVKSLVVNSAPTAPVALNVATTIAQTIQVKLNTPILINSSNTVPGLTIYNLQATTGATAQTVYARGTSIAYTATQATTGTETVLTLSLASLTGASSQIEIVFDAATVTDATGALKLNTNGNNTLGEATDDYIKYLAVAGGTAIGTGAFRSPSANLSGSITYAGGTFVGGTGNTILYTVNDTAGGNNVSASAIFDNANVKLQKFDYDTKAWTDLTYTVSAGATAANVILTAAAAPVAGATYRIFIVDQTAVTESAATAGYTHLYGYGTTKNAVLKAAFQVTGTYTSTAGYVYKAFTTSSVTRTFSNNTNVASPPQVVLVFTGLGTAGLDVASATASNVKIYLDNTYIDASGNTQTDTTLATGVEWTSASVVTTSALNDTLVLNLPTNFTSTGKTAIVRIYGLIDQGALAATGITAGTGKAKLVNVTNQTDLTQAFTITSGL